MDFLRRIPPLGYLVIVVVGGVAFYLLWRHFMNNSGNNAQSTSSVPGANQGINPLNPYGDPNIDPNTGVPYTIEEQTGPNGIPFYYSSPGTPGTPSAPPIPTPQPTAPPQGPYAHSTVLHKLAASLGVTYDQLVKALFAESHATNVPYNTLVAQFESGQGDVTTLKKYLPPPAPQPHNPKDPTGPAVHPVPQNKLGGGAQYHGTHGYVFRINSASGQTPHLASVAMKEYGVTSNSDVNAATDAIIRANPGLRGQSYNYQPPDGTRIVIP